jgi:hypothetical protein
MSFGHTTPAFLCITAGILDCTVHHSPCACYILPLPNVTSEMSPGNVKSLLRGIFEHLRTIAAHHCQSFKLKSFCGGFLMTSRCPFVTSETTHLFIYLLAIWISSFVTCLSRLFFFFFSFLRLYSIGWPQAHEVLACTLCVFLLMCGCFIHSRSELITTCLSHRYISHSVSSLSTLFFFFF